MIDKQLITNRFLKYVVIDTTSDPENPAFPSTEKQWNLAKLLEKELIEIGLEDVELDEGLNLEGSKLLLTFEQAKAARQGFRRGGSMQEL